MNAGRFSMKTAMTFLAIVLVAATVGAAPAHRVGVTVVTSASAEDRRSRLRGTVRTRKGGAEC